MDVKPFEGLLTMIKTKCQFIAAALAVQLNKENCNKKEEKKQSNIKSCCQCFNYAFLEVIHHHSQALFSIGNSKPVRLRYSIFYILFTKWSRKRGYSTVLLVYGDSDCLCDPLMPIRFTIAVNR